MKNADEQIHPHLRAALQTLAKRMRFIRVYRFSAIAWSLAALSLCLLLLLKAEWPFPTAIIAVSVAVPLVAFILELRKNHRSKTEYAKAAGEIELLYPSLNQVLTTSIQQNAKDGSLNFLQQRLLQQALKHPTRFYWDEILKEKLRWLKVAEAGAKLIVIALFIIILNVDSPANARTVFDTIAVSTQIEPGNIEVERGSSLVVTARFEGFEPEKAVLETTTRDGSQTFYSMAKSLSDPVYAFTLQGISEETSYRITYADMDSESFTIEVFDYPSLVQADARIDFPDYTRLDTRSIEDARRISAVEGSQLEYTFQVNKPGLIAQLLSDSGETITLENAPNQATVFTTAFTLENSVRYSLNLIDPEGRTDPRPSKINIEAIKNQIPQLRFDFPKGDQRVSPIEEINMAARASDDFGLLDYGIGFTYGSEPPELISLPPPEFEYERDATFAYSVFLEEKQLKPADLVSWYIWANDFDSQGKERQTVSDLYFAEIRSLDEIFREGEGGESQPGQQSQGNQNEELAKLQRQIAISTWKLKQSSPADSSFLEDLSVIKESQETVKTRLEDAQNRIEDEKILEASNQALEFMDTAIDGLSEAFDDESLPPLDPAWSAAQSAYQALLKMAPKEFNVSRNQQSQSQGGQQQNQQRDKRLDQLNFQEEEDRYETESQAQAIVSEEERQELEALSKLNELARRQQEINERLKELQNALTDALDEAEKEKVRRELKRLEEEQRQMISQLDQTRQKMDQLPSNDSRQESKEQMDQTREDMQDVAENLEKEEVSQALASGSRAQENLDEIKEELRDNASSRFAEQMREARREARELAERQKEIQQELDDLENAPTRQLDDSSEREQAASKLEQQREQLADLMEQVEQIASDSELTEPALHKRLYDMLRKQGRKETDDLLEASSKLLRQGFVEQSNEFQGPIQEAIEQIENSIEKAAESILGSESASLRFAKNELEELSDTLNQERPDEPQPGSASQDTGQPPLDGQASKNGSPSSKPSEESSPQQGDPQQASNSPQGSPSSQPGQQGQSQQPGQPGQSEQPSQSQQQASSQSGGSGGGNRSPASQSLEDFLREMNPGTGAQTAGPITGGDFLEWAERLRTIEELVEEPAARERLSQARERAEEMRREYKRHGAEPQWGSIEDGISTPLNQVRTWLAQELNRIENPDTLQPIDRDPVPQQYEDAVRSYYEALAE